MILIGSRKSNPWVDFFQDQLDFTIGYDSNLHQTGVQNLHPKTGEPQFYPEPEDPRTNVGYGVIAYLPNIGQTGDALIIEGTDSQATEAAGEFATNEESMAALKSRFNSKTFPYFQVLLKTSRLKRNPLHGADHHTENLSGTNAVIDSAFWRRGIGREIGRPDFHPKPDPKLFTHR